MTFISAWIRVNRTVGKWSSFIDVLGVLSISLIIKFGRFNSMFGTGWKVRNLPKRPIITREMRWNWISHLLAWWKARYIQQCYITVRGRNPGTGDWRRTSFTEWPWNTNINRSVWWRWWGFYSVSENFCCCAAAVQLCFAAQTVFEAEASAISSQLSPTFLTTRGPVLVGLKTTIGLTIIVKSLQFAINSCF